MTEVLNDTSINTTYLTELEGPRFYLCGGLELPYADGMQTPTAKKLRQLLALLLTKAGQPVTRETLAQELYGNTLPRSCATTLQTYILQLRRCTGDNGDGIPQKSNKSILRTIQTGYKFDIDPYAVDVLRFIDLVRGTCLGPNDDEQQLRRTLATLDAAFSLIRGPILCDVVCGFELDLFSIQYEELRRMAHLRRIDTSLMLGQHQQTLVELAGLSLTDPFSEDFARRRIVALYRCGRTGEALAACQTLNQALVSALGIEPGPQTKRLHQMVLQGDPALLNPRWMMS